jgi:hypothetical protein
MTTKATARPGGLVRVTAKVGVREAADERVHFAASGFSGNATLCGYLGDYYTAKPQPTSARATCPACLDLVRHVRDLRIKFSCKGQVAT